MSISRRNSINRIIFFYILVSILLLHPEFWVKKMRLFSLPQTVALLQGRALRQIPKLSTVCWWYFLLTDRFN